MGEPVVVVVVDPEEEETDEALLALESPEVMGPEEVGGIPSKTFSVSFSGSDCKGLGEMGTV